MSGLSSSFRVKCLRFALPILAASVVLHGGQPAMAQTLGPPIGVAEGVEADKTSIARDSEGNIYVMYEVLVSFGSDGSENRNLYFASSTDDGLTFSVPRLVASGAVRSHSLAAGGPGEVFVVYVQGNPTDYCRFLPPCPTAPFTASVQFLSSSDGGQSFSFPAEVSTPGTTNVDFRARVTVGETGVVYVLWAESGIDAYVGGRQEPLSHQAALLVGRGAEPDPSSHRPCGFPAWRRMVSQGCATRPHL